MDDLLREAKERLILEGQKAYIAINAAGAATLLAFLQAIWPQAGAASLKKAVLYGIAAFAIGVAVAMLSYLARHWALRKHQFNAGIFYRIAYDCIPPIAILCFLLGLIIPVIGGLDSLGGQTDRAAQSETAQQVRGSVNGRKR
jgi:hypothetical protein